MIWAEPCRDKSFGIMYSSCRALSYKMLETRNTVECRRKGGKSRQLSCASKPVAFLAERPAWQQLLFRTLLAAEAGQFMELTGLGATWFEYRRALGSIWRDGRPIIGYKSRRA